MTKLKSIRESKNLTIQEVATLLEIPISTYAMYENGDRTIPVEIVNKLKEIFSIKSNDIFLPTKFTISKVK